MAQNFAKQLYASTAWRDLAAICKARVAGKCERCGRVITDPKLLIAHHTIELTAANIIDPHIALNPDLIEIVCLDCHNREHRRFGGKQQVYIVWGSPLAGKSEYVRQEMRPGDLLIDIDALWKAVSGQDIYIKPNNLRFNIFALRDALYDQIYTRYGQWYDCYIIGGFANALERNDLAQRLGAETIYIESSKEECLARIKQRPNIWREYIVAWWAEYNRYTPPYCDQ